MRKNCSSVILSFFQVTKVEKRASRKRFLKSRRSRDFGMFSRCPFFNRGNLEKTSNYTRTIFLQFARTIMTTDCFFAMFWFFRMKIRFFVLKSEEKKGWVITPLGKFFFLHRKLWGKIFLHRKLWGKIFPRGLWLTLGRKNIFSRFSP